MMADSEKEVQDPKAELALGDLAEDLEAPEETADAVTGGGVFNGDGG